MDLGIIIAISGSAIAIIGVVIAMMFWVRNESNGLRGEAKEDRKDLLHLHRETEQTFVEHRKEMLQNTAEHRKEMSQISRNMELAVFAIQNEMKDFHYKLLEIERAKNKNV